MSLFEILGALLIGPLKTLFEIIFSVACDITNHSGLSVVVLSLAMNVIVLPLYRRADAIQEAAKDKENEMRDTVRHIKSTFSGDEKMMILQAYYRECNYNPLSVLSGSLSLMLEIPFFMAAYQFLSGVEAFQGLAFGPIADLSAPDGLIRIGGLTLNALPILMTLINVVSSALYLKGYPLKTKLQLYGMALFFLVFLYGRPSGLVLYWTLNNTFALGKTLYYKLPHSKKILAAVLGIAGAALFVFGLTWDRRMEQLMMLGIGLVLQYGWALPLVKMLTHPRKLKPLDDENDALPQPKKRPELKPNTPLFIAGGLFLSILVGLMIPGNFISANPMEYIDNTCFYHPTWYLVETFCLAAGFFLVWLGVFYWLAKPKLRALFSRLLWVAAGVMIVNHLFFGNDLGIISPDLVYENVVRFTSRQILLNFAVLGVLAVGMYLLSLKFRKGLTSVLAIGTAAILTMSIISFVQITYTGNLTRNQLKESGETMPEFTLSKDGENVVVIMLDRAIGPFVPYIMEEYPQLQEQFDGFTFYENTLSYGGFTNLTTPSLFGGYEYTPENVNLRSDVSLEEKQNEALKLLPSLFSQEGYDVTLLDPPYAGYQWTPDLSIFDDLEGVDAYAADGRFNSLETSYRRVETRRRNLLFLSLMKTMPLALQPTVYDEGNYHALPATETSEVPNVNPAFLNAYNTLANMGTMTKVSGDSEGSLLVMRSNMTHEPIVLDDPDFTVTENPTTAVGKTVTAGDSTLVLSTDKQLSHYQTNGAALALLGDWFDQLREAGVYDNTRIIVVADHGRNLGLFDEDYGMRGDGTTMQCIEFYQPLLLVKDFHSTGFTVSTDFMTNADVPLLALADIVDNPVNPFTGTPLTDTLKQEQYQYVILSQEWDIATNNGNQFIASRWAAVPTDEDVSDRSQWIFYTEEETLLPPKN